MTHVYLGWLSSFYQAVELILNKPVDAQGRVSEGIAVIMDRLSDGLRSKEDQEPVSPPGDEVHSQEIICASDLIKVSSVVIFGSGRRFSTLITREVLLSRTFVCVRTLHEEHAGTAAVKAR